MKIIGYILLIIVLLVLVILFGYWCLTKIAEGLDNVMYNYIENENTYIRECKEKYQGDEWLLVKLFVWKMITIKIYEDKDGKPDFNNEYILIPYRNVLLKPEKK